jgi:hypothetical protein
METDRVNDKLQQWLDRCALATGMFGCSIRLPDGVWISHNFNDLCPPTAFDEILRRLADALSTFSAHGFAPRWLTWTFEKGRLRVARRPDGLLLALASRRDSAAANNLDLFTEDFLTLDLKS